MIAFILCRIAYIVPVMLIASFGIFALLRLGGSDPVAQYLILSNLPSTPETIASLRKEFGLDKPLLAQYVLWLQKAVILDFGSSYMSGRPVAEDFFAFLPTTLLLVGLGVVVIIVVSVPLGIVSAHYRDKIPDFLVRFFCFVGVCMPNFWFAFLLVWAFAITLAWLPAVGADSLSSFILPTLSIALMSSCVNTRLIRANMLETSKERHITYATLRHLSQKTILLKHNFLTAILPIITAFGMHIGELIGGALVVESIFALPGIGLYCIQGIANHDYPVIQCFVVVMCLIFTVSNLIIDIIYAYLDPRIYKLLQEAKQ